MPRSGYDTSGVPALVPVRVRKPVPVPVPVPPPAPGDAADKNEDKATPENESTKR